MPLFVSGTRYEEVVQERDALRAENRKLLDRLLMNLGARPVFNPLPEPAATSGPAIEAEKKNSGEDIPLRSGRPTHTTVKGWAEEAARKGKLPEGIRPVTL